eukprot:gene40381-22654_t
MECSLSSAAFDDGARARHELRRAEQQAGGAAAAALPAGKTKEQLEHALFRLQAERVVADLRVALRRRGAAGRRRCEGLDARHLQRGPNRRRLGRGGADGRDRRRERARRGVGVLGAEPAFPAPHAASLCAADDAACRGDLGRVVLQLKDLFDNTLRVLWGLNQQHAGAAGRDECLRTVEHGLGRSRQLVADFARRANAFAVSLCAREEELGRSPARAERRASRDAASEACIRPPTPRDVADMRDEAAHYRARLRE